MTSFVKITYIYLDLRKVCILGESGRELGDSGRRSQQ